MANDKLSSKMAANSKTTEGKGEGLHPTQQAMLMALEAGEPLLTMSFGAIGETIGVRHPQKVKHHYEQLVKKGLLPPKLEMRLKSQTIGVYRENEVLRESLAQMRQNLRVLAIAVPETRQLIETMYPGLLDSKQL